VAAFPSRTLAHLCAVCEFCNAISPKGTKAVICAAVLVNILLQRFPLSRDNVFRSQ
jgi:hypothetical protein